MNRNQQSIRTAERTHGELHPTHRSKRSGFTLVELLMVMLIIAMLVALVSSAVWQAKIAAVNARVTVEINQMAIELREYHADRGGYPPDIRNWPDAEILVRLKANFPKWNSGPASDLDTNFPHLFSSNYADRLDEAEQLVFFLGGYWDTNKMVGFNAHPRTPFAVPTLGDQRTAPLFDFVETRLFDRDSDGFPEYYPDLGNPIDAMPFVLFVARRTGTYMNFNNVPPVYDNSDSLNILGEAIPLISSAGAGTDWVDSDAFQIICAGIDGDFGPADDLHFPSGRNYTTFHYDNLTSFTKGTLEKAIP